MRRDATVPAHRNPGPSGDSLASSSGGEDAGGSPSMAWRKSSASSVNGNCVEVATLSAGRMAVRDSKDKNGPILRFSRDEWHQFMSEIQDGISPES
jgi:Domain of unknown function (DUF397)